jgi:hypothetical protein
MSLEQTAGRAVGEVGMEHRVRGYCPDLVLDLAVARLGQIQVGMAAMLLMRLLEVRIQIHNKIREAAGFLLQRRSIFPVTFTATLWSCPFSEALAEAVDQIMGVAAAVAQFSLRHLVFSIFQEA